MLPGDTEVNPNAKTSSNFLVSPAIRICSSSNTLRFFVQVKVYLEFCLDLEEHSPTRDPAVAVAFACLLLLRRRALHYCPQQENHLEMRLFLCPSLFHPHPFCLFPVLKKLAGVDASITCTLIIGTGQFFFQVNYSPIMLKTC